ncbi:MAG TPA: Na+/H+ antiporter, partial [Methylomirabilota bacterium]
MAVPPVFVLLFVVASVVAIAAGRLRVPYTVALVVAGLVLGALHLFEPPHLTKELLFTLILPGLLFEAAFHVEFSEFWRDRLPILALAIPGVVLATALTAALLVPLARPLGFTPDFHWPHGLLFGALIAATDPIAVVGLFRTLGAPRRLSLLVEGESLLNDGTAIVFFTLALGLVSGHTVSPGGIAVDFVRVVGSGILIGVAIGVALSQVIRRVDDPMVEITLSTVAAYGTFIVAEQFHYSGVIATVTAGMLCGNYGARMGMSPSTRIAADTFWEYVAFALNSIVFLLIGFEVRVGDLAASWPAILVAYGAVILTRAAVVLGASGLLRFTRDRIPTSWAGVLTWGGLRGALSMVLALSLPADFPSRSLVVTMTFGVVVLSILVQGVSMSALLRWLGLVADHGARSAYALAQGKLRAANAALQTIEAMSHARAAPPEVLGVVRQEYETRVAAIEQQVERLRLVEEHLREDEFQETRRHLLLVEKDLAIDLYHRGTLDREAYEALLADIDARLLQ